MPADAQAAARRLGHHGAERRSRQQRVDLDEVHVRVSESTDRGNGISLGGDGDRHRRIDGRWSVENRTGRDDVRRPQGARGQLCAHEGEHVERAAHVAHTGDAFVSTSGRTVVVTIESQSASTCRSHRPGIR